MKERRAVGATHSFRLSPKASQIVDEMIHPRRLGGKSAKVSAAIEAYYGKILDRNHDQPSYAQLLQNIQALQHVIKGLHIDIEALKARNGSGEVKNELHQFTSSGQIADNEVDNSVPTSRGWKRFFGFFKRY